MKTSLFKLTLNLGLASRYYDSHLSAWLNQQEEDILSLLSSNPQKCVDDFTTSFVPLLSLIRKNGDRAWVKIISKVLNFCIKSSKKDKTSQELALLTEFKENLISTFLKSPNASIEDSYEILDLICENEDSEYYSVLEKKYNFTFYEKVYCSTYLTRTSHLNNYEAIASSLVSSPKNPTEKALALIVLCTQIIPSLMYRYKNYTKEKSPQLASLINLYIEHAEALLPLVKSPNFEYDNLYKTLKEKSISFLMPVFKHSSPDTIKTELPILLEKELIKALNVINPEKLEQAYLLSARPLFNSFDFATDSVLITDSIYHDVPHLIKILNSFPEAFHHQYTSALVHTLFTAIYTNNLEMVKFLMPQERDEQTLMASHPSLSPSIARAILALNSLVVLKSCRFPDDGEVFDFYLQNATFTPEDKLLVIERALGYCNKSLYNKVAHWPHFEINGAHFFEMIQSALSNPRLDETSRENQLYIIKDLLKKENDPGFYLTSHKKGLISLPPDLLDFLTSLKEKALLSHLSPAATLFLPSNKVKQKI